MNNTNDEVALAAIPISVVVRPGDVVGPCVVVGAAVEVVVGPAVVVGPGDGVGPCVVVVVGAAVEVVVVTVFVSNNF